MKIVEIKALENGGHRNQTGEFKTIPDGWAVIPEDMKTDNFPFGEATAEEIDGVMTVTSWTPGTVPTIEEPDAPVSGMERLRADISNLQNNKAERTEVDAIWNQMAEAYSEGVQEA